MYHMVCCSVFLRYFTLAFDLNEMEMIPMLYYVLL